MGISDLNVMFKGPGTLDIDQIFDSQILPSKLWYQIVKSLINF